MSNYKFGDRVKITDGVGRGQKGTFITVDQGINQIMAFINTDKPNEHNHDNHGGNGLLKSFDFITPLGSKTGKWSNSELDILHKDYRRKSVTDIAESLDRTYYSVQSKARKEKIHNHPRREYNARDNRFIQHCMIDRDFTENDIASQLHRSNSSLDGRLSLMESRGQLPSIPNEVK